jgi:hypothetical protein
MVFKISRVSAELLQKTWPTMGAMGAGRGMFDNLGALPVELESTWVVEAPGVTHLGFRIVK